jgi:hypothetical protein
VQSTEGEDPLASALEKYALAEEKVGEARLAQDAQIQSRFLAGWNTTLNTNLMFAAKARKNVENARLTLDSVKAAKKAAARGDLDNLSEDARAEIEQAEDEFVGQTEEAVSVMKNVCFLLSPFPADPPIHRSAHTDINHLTLGP